MCTGTKSSKYFKCILSQLNSPKEINPMDIFYLAIRSEAGPKYWNNENEKKTTQSRYPYTRKQTAITSISKKNMDVDGEKIILKKVTYL